jgi:hypothetical protein
VKIFALEDTLGIDPLNWNLFGQTGSLSFTAGTLLWPVVFIMTDTINEFFGKRGVRFISWLAVVLIGYGFLFAFAAISLAPASWWVTSMDGHGVPDYQAVRSGVRPGHVDHRRFAGGLPARPADRRGGVPSHPPGHRRAPRVAACDRIHRDLAGGGQLRGDLDRLRARPAALADLAVPGGRSVNYIYKMGFAIALIPLLYLMRRAITRYLGADRAAALRAAAAAD